jgi:predicted nucleic acid-binding protein
MIEDGGITNHANKGIRDHRLADKAHLIEKDQDTLKHEILNASQRRSELYSVEKLLPTDLMEDIAYKNTFKAL